MTAMKKMTPAVLVQPANVEELHLQQQVGPVVDTLFKLYRSQKRAQELFETRKSRYQRALEKTLGTVAEAGFQPEVELAVEGGDVVMKIGKEAEETTVTNPAAALRMLETVQTGLGYSLIRFSITDLREALNRVEFNAITETHFTGKRRVTFRVKK